MPHARPLRPLRDPRAPARERAVAVARPRADQRHVAGLTGVLAVMAALSVLIL